MILTRRRNRRERCLLANPRLEEQILAVRVGEGMPLDGPIHIADYDPQWPRLFKREAARIQAALGERVLLLEHVGSTSVPGLAAQPRIDIILVVANSADEFSYVRALEAVGYMLCIRELLVRAPRVQGARHGRQPPCFLVGLPRDRSHATLPRLVAQQRS
jgi:GrpB-like predicted nucleotidyltransferase (UPF0157 family)